MGKEKNRANLNGKKAGIFIPAIVIIVFIALVWGFIIAQSKSQAIAKDGIGKKQFEIFKVYQRAEKALLFTDISAKLATRQAIYDLGKKGGFDEPPKCAEHAGSRLWFYGDSYCLPSEREEFKGMLEEDLAKILVDYDDAVIPAADYEFQYDSTSNIIGKSKRTIEFPIGMPSIPAYDAFDPYSYTTYDTIGRYFAPRGPEPRETDKMIRIKDLYHDMIMRVLADEQQAGRASYAVSPSIIAAIIAKESNGNPCAVGDNGASIGISQANYGTAIAYRNVFGDLYPRGSFSCKGMKCNCWQVPDGRYDVANSIRFIARYMTVLIDAFPSYDDKLIFAIASYNGGAGVIQSAIEQAKKTTANKNPRWSDVSANLMPWMVTYFRSDPKQQVEKVGIIHDYVNKVLIYNKAYEDILEPGNQLAMNAPPRSIADTSSAPRSGQPTLGQEEQMKLTGSGGRYSVRPSFRVSLGYDFADYKEAKQVAEHIILQCNNTENASLCVTEILENVNTLSLANDGLQWRYGSCGGYEERIFYEFVQGMTDCRNSREDSCFCEIKLPADQSPKENDVTIKMVNTAENAALYAQRHEKGKDIDLTISAMIPQTVVGTANDNAGQMVSNIEDASIRISYDQGIPSNVEKLFIFSRSNANENGWVYDDSNKLSYENNRIRFYKEGKRISIIKPMHASSQIFAKPCEQSRIFRICALSRSTINAHDEVENKIMPRRIGIGFALQIPDKTAPLKIEGVTAQDVPDAENKIKLYWLPNKYLDADGDWDYRYGLDLHKYKIYYSRQPFVRTTDEGVYLGGEVGNEVDFAVISDLQDYDHSSLNNKYYFAVTGEDYSGNQMTWIGTSNNIATDEIDDTKPLMEGSVSASADARKIEISWQKVEKNADASMIADFVQYKIMSGNNILASIPDQQQTHAIIENAQLGTYKIRITAVDESGSGANEIESNEITVR